MALATPSVPEAERRAIIASRLPHPVWPPQRLKIVAVDAESGEERVFDNDSGVDLVDAVAASCAVPGVWPPVTIGEHRYMDGGMRSITNADLAQDAERVLVVSLLNLEGAQSTLPQEVAQLEAGGSAGEGGVAGRGVGGGDRSECAGPRSAERDGAGRPRARAAGGDGVARILVWRKQHLTRAGGEWRGSSPLCLLLVLNADRSGRARHSVRRRGRSKRRWLDRRVVECFVMVFSFAAVLAVDKRSAARRVRCRERSARKARRPSTLCLPFEPVGNGSACRQPVTRENALSPHPDVPPLSDLHRCCRASPGLPALL